MKKFFILILVALAFAAGAYVGRLPIADLVLGKSSVSTQSNPTPQARDTLEETASPSASIEKPVTVSATQLSAGQRELLEKLGIDTDALIITPAMIACAEAKVGAARLAEIQAGATPTFTEGASLLGCYR